MSTLIQAAQLRLINMGQRVSKSTGTLAATTVPIFTIAGGEVLVTSLHGLVTTTISVANTYKLQINPTTGDTKDLCAATDIGTSATAAGSLLTFALATTTAPPKLLAGAASPLTTVVTTGQIESVSGGTDGVITWVAFWIPLTDGATLVAA